MLDPAMPGAVPCPAAWWPLPLGVAGHKAGLVQGHLGCSCLPPAPKGWDTPPLQDQDPPKGWDLGCSARKTLLRHKQREGDQVVTLL